MNRAKLFATYFHAEDKNTLHIYDDGFVLLVACATDRHLAIRKSLLQEWPHLEEARSDDGFMSVFVLEGHVPDDRSDISPWLVTVTDAFRDHRFEDWHTLEVLTEVVLSRLPQGQRAAYEGTC
jgi:hypothetical protein